jgi:hypothetical protein
MKIFQSKRPAQLGNLIPTDPRMEINEIFIGSEKDYYSYTTTDTNGRITHNTRSFFVYDFGFSVTNKSNIPMTVQFRMVEMDAQGFILKDYYANARVNPMEKRKVWTGFRLKKLSNFRSYIIKEITMGPTQDKSYTISAETKPGKSIHEVLDVPFFNPWVIQRAALVILALLILFYWFSR